MITFVVGVCGRSTLSDCKLMSTDGLAVVSIAWGKG